MANGFRIAIEAGNKTTVLLISPDGDLVGRGTSGPSTYASVGHERCGQALWAGIINAFSSAGVRVRDLLATESQLPQVDAICIGMPGIERPKDESALKRIFNNFNLTQNVLITSDAHINLAAGSPEGYGVAVMAGDNGLALGLSRNGNKARSGGWGYLLGDEGSAYWLGLEAIKAALAAADGRGQETILTGWLEQEWKIPPNRPDSLAKQVYNLSGGLGSGGNKAQLVETVETYRQGIGALAPLVERAAQKNDEVAASILDRAAGVLASAADAAADRAGVDKVITAAAAFDATWILKGESSRPKLPLVFAGSVLLSNQGELRRRLAERLKGRFAEPVLVTDAATGAMKLALTL